MSSLRRDLVERKLWMIVALLVVAVAAVPVFLLKTASASTTPTVPAPAAAPAATQAPTPATQMVDTKEQAKVVLARIARNPFASAVPKLSSKPASPSSSGPSTSTTSATPATSTPAPSSSGSSNVAMVSPAPTSTQPSGTSSTSHTSTGSSTASTPASTTPTSTVASTSPSAPATHPAEVETWTTYSVDVRFGKSLQVPLRADIARLTPLPSAQEPDVMFEGVMSNGNAAVFALRQGVGHTGPGWCHPDHSTCSVIVLKPGQTEDLTIPGANGTVQTRMLRVVRITSRVTHSQKVALAAFHRVSPSGLCDLVLANPLLYHLDTGTYSNIPKEACAKYPDAVPFSYLRSAP
jgi:hypothetical protein